MKTKIILFLIAGLLAIRAYSQPWNAFPGGNFLVGGEWLGSTNNFPLDFQTVSIPRMRLHSSGELSLATYLAVDPLVLPPLPSPISAMLNVGGGNKNIYAGSTWRAAIKVSNHGMILFDNENDFDNSYYFVAHPSANPLGDTYHGYYVKNFNGLAFLEYVYKIYGRSRPGQAFRGTHQFGYPMYLWPINNVAIPQSSQTLQPCSLAVAPTGADVWLDNFGLFQSEPLNVEVPAPVAATNEGLVVADDYGIFNRKLTFSGNNTDVLQGDGTWGTGSGFGLCSNPLPQLAGDVGLDFNDKSIYFQDPIIFPPATTKNDIGIGWNCGIGLAGKFDVRSITNTNANYNFTHAIAGNFYQTGDYSRPPASGLDDMIGVRGESDVRETGISISNRNNVGGDFYASQALTNIGARGTASGFAYTTNIGLRGNGSNTGVNYGVYGQAIPAGPNAGAFDIGVYGYTTSVKVIPGNLNYAVYGDLGPTVVPCPPVPGPAPPCAFATWPDCAGYFNGDVATTTGYWVTSDASLKTNIQNLANPMGLINQLFPKSYYFNQQQNLSMYLLNGLHYGLLAQNVDSVLPGLVKD